MTSGHTASGHADAPAGAGNLPPRIGPFRILKLLGEGGMGRVYLAEQDEPHREVALKVLASGSASTEFQKRFQREIEVLAALEHSGIARMYQAGIADEASHSVPYLAMEYVRGSDLLTHAKNHALDLRAKLALMVGVCRAVHYAHTRGAIHRDLKPGNILVAQDGQPKILDFGVAYVTSGNDMTQMTVAGEILGTVPYMPLEQLGGQAKTVDPRWDVYALGVIAYELLSGELPYPGMSKATVLTALQQVINTAPVRLSKRIEGVDGDVETIVGKAMAQEADQRYSSAAELGADIERYLENRPIEARRPTARYIMGLFVRRHRAVTAAALLTVAALIAATVVSLSFAYSARQRAAEREAVNNFMEKMFTAADPDHSLGERLSVRDVLDVARRELDTHQDLPPSSVAQLQRTLGKTYISLGLAQQGLDLLRAAQATVDAESGADSVEALRMKVEVAHAQTEAGQEGEALKTLKPLLDGLKTASGEREKIFLQARVQWSDIEINQGNAAEAEAQLREILPALDRIYGSSDDLTLQDRYNIAQALHDQAKYDESIAEAQQVVDLLTQRLGPEHPRVQLAWDVIANNDRELAKFDEAEKIYRNTIAVRERVLGPDHPQTHMARISLASLLALAGRANEGAPIARAAHEGILRYLGPDAEVTTKVASLRAYVVSETGAWDEAAEIDRTLVAHAEARPGGPTLSDLTDYNNLANALKKTGHLDEALAVFTKLLPRAEALVGKEHLHYALFELNKGDVLTKLGRLPEARAALEHSYGVLHQQIGDDHPYTLKAIERLKGVYLSLGLKAEAAALPVPKPAAP